PMLVSSRTLSPSSPSPASARCTRHSTMATPSSQARPSPRRQRPPPPTRLAMPPSAAAHAPAMSAEAARGHLDRFAARTRHLDRLRALELLHLASAVFVLGFRSETSRTALDALFPSVNGQETTAGAASQGAADDADTPTALPGAAAADTESFCNH